MENGRKDHAVGADVEMILVKLREVQGREKMTAQCRLWEAGRRGRVRRMEWSHGSASKG